ncbi:hypothetical protein [Marinomonas transparens]|uniref:Uncharacterized protein n=1 Tax=Marinomonas transparens TaxID=2795388 RepID=A0A934JNC3_9GAMM|nr:hypothetical protein [Marinomonas transparens]MBJ7536688.1 hypothetical protein [Marinomonas transparens]
MTAITITVLLLVIGGFIAFAIVLQMKEQARLEKLRKIARLNNQLRQIRRYLDDLPPQYQPKDMRLWLFSRMIAVYDEILVVQPDGTLNRRRNNLAEEMTTFQTDKKKRRTKPINDEVLVMELKRLFESFKLFIAQSKKEKTLDGDTAFRYTNMMEFYSHKIHVDFHAYLARHAFLSGNMTTAIEMYKEAIAQIEPIQEFPEAQPLIEQYNETISEIESDMALQEAEENIMASEDGEDEEELDDEWDKFIDNSTFQKKERF